MGLSMNCMKPRKKYSASELSLLKLRASNLYDNGESPAEISRILDISYYRARSLLMESGKIPQKKYVKPAKCFDIKWGESLTAGVSEESKRIINGAWIRG